MKARTVLLIGIGVLLISLALLNPATRVNANPVTILTASVNPSWKIKTIDSNGDVGNTLSLALQPGTDKPYISYYDFTNKDLKLAFPVSGGGDCGPGNTWSCNSLKFTNKEDFGYLSSIAFDQQGDWGIVYDDLSLGSNNFRGMPAVNTTEQFWANIDDALHNFPAHASNSFHYDGNGIGHVAFIALDNLFNPYLRYASYVGIGGNCGINNSWQCDTIVKVSFLGMIGYAALVFENNLPYIVYRDVNNHLAIAANLGGFSGNCGPGNSWHCEMVDATVQVGGFLSTNIDSQNFGIAYIDATTHSLRYADMVSSGGNCSQVWLHWNCITIDDVGSQTQTNNGATIDQRNGEPLIAYNDLNDQSNNILKVAYPQAGGNCGPKADGKYTWRCEVVDNGGGTKNVGEFASLAVGPTGDATIAYYDASDGALKLAYHAGNQVFLPFVHK